MPGTVTFTAATAARPPMGLSLARRFIVRLARQIDRGQIVIQTPSGETIHCTGARPGPVARLTLYRWRAAWRLLMDGDIGFAEAYMDGDWSSPDLTALIELAAVNHAAMIPSMNGARLSRLIHRLSHLRRRNTKRGSQRNIPAQYDLGNDFYAAWLDPGRVEL